MSIVHLGFYNTSSTRTHVRFAFTTHAQTGANVAPNSAFEAADIRIYKATDGAAVSATQRSSANGITMTSPFDSLTGVHTVDIDLTDNTDASFYASGSQYTVVLAPDETIDGLAVTQVLAYFEIGHPVPWNTAWDAEVQSEVQDALDAAAAEPTGVPAASASLLTKIGVLYMMARNKVTVSATKKTFYDDGDAAEFEKDLTDAAGTYTETEVNAI